MDLLIFLSIDVVRGCCESCCPLELNYHMNDASYNATSASKQKWAAPQTNKEERTYFIAHDFQQLHRVSDNV